MKATASPSPPALFPCSHFRRLRPFPSLRNPNPLPSRALSSSFSRRPRRRRRLPSVPSPTESSYPPDYQSLELSIPVDGVAGVVERASSAGRRLLSAGADAFHDLRTSVRVDPGRRIVLSCRRSSLIFLAGALLWGLAVVVAARVLLWLVRPLGSGFGEREVVVRRRDRSLGGREVVVGRWEGEGRRKSLRGSVSPLELRRGDGVRVVRRNVVSGIRFAGKERLPKWWVEKSSLLAEGPVGAVDFQREADRLVRAIVDKRTSGMDYKDDDIIQLRQICKISGAKVSFGTINARDSFYRAAVAFVLHICSRVPDSAFSVEIGGEEARQFICGLADNIGLQNIRAARIVCAAVAAQTRSSFLQTWALEVQGKRFEALEELLKICQILKTFPPEDGSPEMEMVAGGLKKSLSAEQREHLLTLFRGVCGSENHKIAEEALGLVIGTGLEGGVGLDSG